ncbi:hypothetical protein [Arthrobacter sp. SLBN-53]|uniref:hypothetical protein n=1 Tax=Arthrobacter sp. SLBN-53 TaxID=2768412 RepID=UPI00114D85F2|nr:hypothetical protein [Arthrobacter sp. SLBN-53]TQK27293.1 hypothetical protein FBY28_0244 [Arthrobacter sp. SLBN-53]
MADGEIFVIDRVITRPGRARQFVDSYLSGYAPSARERGMRLVNLLVSPPIWFDTEPNTVTATWVLPSAQAWWEMTWQGRPDPAVGAWWDSVAELVLQRERDAAAAHDDVDGLCDV